MEEITLELETVTPLFIAGADQGNIENEGLRAPSLRGLLRWWFRAIMGGVKFYCGNLNLKSIKEEEGKLWGTTERQSKVLLNIFPIDSRVSTFQNIRGRGIRYLSYGSFGRPYIDIGSRFEMHIFFRGSISDEDKKKVTATLWLLLNLGNVGSKSRKGFGSLKVTRDVTISGIEFKNPNSLEELKDYLKNNLKKCLSIFGWDGTKPRSTPLPPYSIIAPLHWKMKILGTTHDSAIDAINYIGEKIREYREDRGNPSARHTRPTRRGTFSYWVTRDYSSVKSIYNKSSPSTPQGSIFGLPHQFQFQSINKKAIVKGIEHIAPEWQRFSQIHKKAIVKGIEHDRRASPLYIKIWKLNDNQYAIGLQLFKSLFIPEDKLRISDLTNPNIKADVDPPPYTYLENFLNKLPGRWIRI